VKIREPLHLGLFPLMLVLSVLQQVHHKESAVLDLLYMP